MNEEERKDSESEPQPEPPPNDTIKKDGADSPPENDRAWADKRTDRRGDQ